MYFRANIWGRGRGSDIYGDGRIDPEAKFGKGGDINKERGEEETKI